MPAAKRRIEWLPEAIRNLDSQIAFVSERNPKAAARLRDRVYAVVGRLRRSPLSACAGRLSGTRELVVPQTPYVVIYRVEDAAVVILRVLYGAQDWPPREDAEED